MKVYEIDDGSIYFVAATGIREAVKLYWKALDDTGGGDEDRHLNVYEVIEKRARHITINVNDERQENAWTLAQQEGPGVLGCSEWP